MIHKSLFITRNLLRPNLCRAITTSQNSKLTDICERGGVRIITLNEPTKRNVLGMAMMDALNEHLTRDWCDTSLRCIIINANGKVWSAGHDLKELSAATPTQQREIFEKLTEIILNIRQAPVPVIARVNGLVAAAGCQLVASCDMVIASDNSKFVTPAARFGVFASTPGVALARAMNSPSKVAYMLMSSLPITAKEAYDAGLVTRLVAESQLDEEINIIVEAIKSQSRTVVAHGKDFFYKQLAIPELKEAYVQATESMVENLAMEDGKEGIRSFIEKRKPQWKHKL